MLPNKYQIVRQSNILQQQRMKEYFKYFSVQELRDEIRNRFAGAKLKINSIHEKREQSVDRKFYNYVSDIKSKQRDYQSILNEPTELNHLLKKRRAKINESLDKYQRNLKCKTLNDFHIQQLTKFHKDNQQLPNTNPISNYSSTHHHTLLQKGRNSLNPRSKTQANFFIKDQKEGIKSGEEVEDKRLRSITKVINITVSNELPPKLFSFAKSNSNCKVNASAVQGAKKAIRFETAPSYNQQNRQLRKQPQPQRSVDQICIKKIKERISLNFNNCKTLIVGSKAKMREIQLLFEEESLKRFQLKQHILSSNNIYQLLKSQYKAQSK